MSKPRNSKIELLRFIFCIDVLMFHTGKYLFGMPSFDEGLNWALFPHGGMAVEFFFLLSGFLMAKTICTRIEAEHQLSAGREAGQLQETVRFLIHKYFSILPQHLVAFVLAFVMYAASENLGIKKIIEAMVESIPNLLLIQMSGISMTNVNHVEWYISCMLLAMMIVYPICRRHYTAFARFYAPAVSLFVFGYMLQETGSLTGVTVWMGVCYKSLLRAIVEISLGVSTYELYRFIKQKSAEFSSRVRTILGVTEVVSLVLMQLYMISTLPLEYEIYIVPLMMLLIALSFSDASGSNRYLSGRVCSYLGSLSLPIYLAQLSAIYFVTGFMQTAPDSLRLAAVLLLTFLFAKLIQLLGSRVKKILLS